MDERTGMLLEWMNEWKDRNVVGKDERMKGQECCWNEWMEEITGMLLEWMNGWNDMIWTGW